MMKLTSSGLTHVGMKRSHNEDCLRISRDENLFIVADGMGGHASGEVASEMSAETLVSFYQTSSLDENLTWPYRYDYTQSYEENRIRVGVQLSNHRIYSASTQDIKLKGMGTTMVAMSFYEQQCSIGHVGDSRVYLYRQGQLSQLTEDHSLLNDYIKMKPGGMTEEEIEAFPHKNVIVRALGMKADVMVDVITQDVQAGDLYILCSDGLSGMITDREMAAIIQSQIESSQGVYKVDLDSLCVHLINAANQNGGNDNVTALIVRCESLSATLEDDLHSQSPFIPVWLQTSHGFQKDASVQGQGIKAQSKPVQVQKKPVQAAQVQSKPVQAAQVQSKPVHVAQAQSKPVQVAQASSKPAPVAQASSKPEQAVQSTSQPVQNSSKSALSVPVTENSDATHPEINDPSKDLSSVLEASHEDSIPSSSSLPTHETPSSTNLSSRTLPKLVEQEETEDSEPTLQMSFKDTAQLEAEEASDQAQFQPAFAKARSELESKLSQEISTNQETQEQTEESESTESSTQNSTKASSPTEEFVSYSPLPALSPLDSEDGEDDEPTLNMNPADLSKLQDPSEEN